MTLETRSKITDRFLRGFGLEMGAGLSPTQSPLIDGLAIVDIRDALEFEAYFGKPPSYPILTLSEAKRQFSNGVDFIVAHHVLEHCDNPIHVLAAEWVPLLAANGVLYISIPSHTHLCESLRLPTPIEHILDDYYFCRSSASYESKQHIYSFILQWTAYSPECFWYAKDGLNGYAEQALREALPDKQDLHWHTYTQSVALLVIEAAFYASRSDIEWLWHEETNGEIHLVCRRQSWSGRIPLFLVDYKKRLMAAVASI